MNSFLSELCAWLDRDRLGKKVVLCRSVETGNQMLRMAAAHGTPAVNAQAASVQGYMSLQGKIVIYLPGKPSTMGPDSNVQRDENISRGWFVLKEKDNARSVQYAPPEWEEHKKEETEYLKAEKVRLKYVALTRAEDEAHVFTLRIETDGGKAKTHKISGGAGIPDRRKGHRSKAAGDMIVLKKNNTMPERCEAYRKVVPFDRIKALTADTLVFVTPIYYYEMSGQMKTLLDRLNPLYPSDYKFRNVYMMSVAAENDIHVPDRAVNRHEAGVRYAERLAAYGYAAYVFDFCGGSAGGTQNRSDGSNSEMSVLTKASDLSAVLDAAKAWPFVDSDKIFLLGGSQGGLVTIITGCERQDELAGMMLMYPALSAKADSQANSYASPEDVPLFGGWMHVGRNYITDLWQVDFDQLLASCRGKLLLLHGDRDSTVDVSWSEKAVEIIPDCEFHVISGGGHEFYGQPFEDAMGYILSYIDGQLNDAD